MLSSSSVLQSISLSTSTTFVKSCLCCGGSHSLQKCDKFIGFSYVDRVAFIKANRLCFGCFFSGHISKDFRRRMKCEVCQKFHPTLLHRFDDVYSSNESLPQVVSNALSSTSSNVEKTCSVVPV